MLDTWLSLKNELESVGILLDKNLDEEIKSLVNKKYNELGVSNIDNISTNTEEIYFTSKTNDTFKSEKEKYMDDIIKAMDMGIVKIDENGNLVYTEKTSEKSKKIA